MTSQTDALLIGIAWCLAWGDQSKPQHPDVIEQMRQALQSDRPLPDSAQPFLKQAQQLNELKFPNTRDELEALAHQHPNLWNARVGLIYGGATKIKQYVFEAAKLPDIRGASALLDRINSFDIPAFFGRENSTTVKRWLDEQEPFQGLRNALIPQLVIYSTGGNILALCPSAYVEVLANAIERRYTEETLTANSCAVGATFRLLEVKFGLLKDPIDQTFWLDQYRANQDNPIVKAYFDQESVTDVEEKFRNRKNFTELVTQLTGQYNQRRSGYDLPQSDRPSRRYPPMFETHPYLRRDEGDRRSAVAQIRLASEPYVSDALARKKIMGQRAKSEESARQRWYTTSILGWRDGQVKKLWKTGRFQSWELKFQKFLEQSGQAHDYYHGISERKVTGSRTLREIGNISKTQGFVAYIYADGNNMGGYIQKAVHTPQEHQQFSNNVFEALQHSVFLALADHLQTRELKGLNDPDNIDRNGEWIHPFEIVTIGGDDVLLIVPADQALSIAKTIGEEFENYLINVCSNDGRFIYRANETYDSKVIHRYQSPKTSDKSTDQKQCKLSMSIGVLITAEDTPIYYAQKLVDQLLKSAKKKVKDLNKKLRELNKKQPEEQKQSYLGGTIDFLALKSVTMLSDKIETFRKEGLTKEIKIKGGEQILKQYAAPYTLHEIGGLINTVKALKKADFPRSQLYQIRSLLDRGKHTAILNYRYFRVRLKPEKNQRVLKHWFEQPWCEAKTNDGNIAPWIYFKTVQGNKETTTGYETIWRDLVDLYSFIEEPQKDDRTFDLPVEAAEVKS